MMTAIEEPTFVFEFRSVGWCADKEAVDDGELDVPMVAVAPPIGITDEERARVASYIHNLKTIEELRSQGLLPPPPPPKRRRPQRSPPTDLFALI